MEANSTYLSAARVLADIRETGVCELRQGPPLLRFFSSCWWSWRGCELEFQLSSLVLSSAHDSFGPQCFACSYHSDQLCEDGGDNPGGPMWDDDTLGKVLVTESKKKEKKVNLLRNGSQSTNVLSGSAQEGNVIEFKEEKGPAPRTNSWLNSRKYYSIFLSFFFF